MALTQSNSRFNRIKSLVRSIRFRLTIWYLLILAIVLLIFGSIVYTAQAQSGRAELENTMRATALRLSTTYPFGKDVQLQGPGKVNGFLLGENDLLIMVDAEGNAAQLVGTVSDTDMKKVVASSGVARQVEINQINDRIMKLKAAQSSDPKAQDELAHLLKTLSNADPRDELFFVMTISENSGREPNRDYLFFSTSILLNNDGLGAFILGRPREDESQLQRLLLALLLAAPLTLLVAAAGGYWLAARAMRPVQAITRTAREMGETELHRRLNLKSHDELGELATTFDGMLDRLEGSFNRQRQFTADASHELRTPLTIVDLEVGRALASRRTPEEYRQALSIIQAENAQMTRLVSSLLTLARADAKRAVLKLETLDLSDLALEVVERLEPLARQKGVALSTGDLPDLQIEGDRTYLGQLLANLVENGIKYSCGHGPGRWVRVETGIVPGTGEKEPLAWVRVEDNGPGIAAEHLPHLFDRFYRVDAARTQNSDEGADLEGRPEGSGLGLSIARWVAEAHGGELRVESQVGVGSTFEVRLPLSKQLGAVSDQIGILRPE